MSVNIYDVAELTSDGAPYWLAMDGWTPDEVALLIRAIDPRRLENWKRVTGAKQLPNAPYEFEAVQKSVARAFEANVLVSPAAPSAVIAWAMEKGMQLPAPLIPEGMVLKGGNWVKLDTPHAPEQEPATPAPAAVVAFAGTVKVWTAERKEAARAMLNEQKMRGIKAFAANTAAAFEVSPARLRDVLNDKPKKAHAKKPKGVWDV